MTLNIWGFLYFLKDLGIQYKIIPIALLKSYKKKKKYLPS